MVNCRWYGRYCEAWIILTLRCWYRKVASGAQPPLPACRISDRQRTRRWMINAPLSTWHWITCTIRQKVQTSGLTFWSGAPFGAATVEARSCTLYGMRRSLSDACADEWSGRAPTALHQKPTVSNVGSVPNLPRKRHFHHPGYCSTGRSGTDRGCCMKGAVLLHLLWQTFRHPPVVDKMLAKLSGHWMFSERSAPVSDCRCATTAGWRI